MTKIEWTEKTWNPLAGCTILSPACRGCFAMKDAHRLAGNPNPKIATKYAGTTKTVKGKPVWTGRVNIASDEVLTQPLRWKKPRMIFVNSMSDIFHEAVPEEAIDRIFAVMALCPQHTFQLLTKRPERMRVYLKSEPYDAINAQAGTLMLWEAMPERDVGPLSNVWLGVSVEDQKRADERIPVLLDTPAAVRWISAEPLLGPIDLTGFLPCRCEKSTDCPTPADFKCWSNIATLDWVVCGGESGPTARPMHPDWARSLRDQCNAASTPFLFKQWGSWLPGQFGPPPALEWQGNGPIDDANLFPADWDHEPKWDDGMAYIDEGEQVFFYKAGKKAAGRLLDGIEHNGFPEVAT